MNNTAAFTDEHLAIQQTVLADGSDQNRQLRSKANNSISPPQMAVALRSTTRVGDLNLSLHSIDADNDRTLTAIPVRQLTLRSN
jgi:hypothetical protein